MELNISENYDQLVHQISEIYIQGQRKAVAAVNSTMVETYWQIGQYIIEFEQGGHIKAAYGKALLPNLSKDLILSFGKGFSLSNIIRMRQLYVIFPIYAELLHKLSWTHLVELLKIDDPIERSFYTRQTMLENWSTTELIRQKEIFIVLAPGSLER